MAGGVPLLLGRVVPPAAVVAGAALFALAGWWLRFLPPWPTYPIMAGLTFLVTAAVGPVAFFLLAAWPPAALRRAAGGLAAGVLAAFAAYLLLLVFGTYPVSSRGDRVIGSWAYSPQAQEYVALRGTRMPVQEVLDDMGDDPDTVFEPISLGAMRLVVLGTWFVAAFGLSALAAVLGLLLSRRPADPAVAGLQARLRGWPAAFDPRLRAGLEQALQTLTDVGNVPAAILTVSGLVEGEEGLLGLVAGKAHCRLKEKGMEKQIEELRGQGALPPLIASDLHWIRLRSNKARHEPKAVTAEDARTAVERAVHVIEWYHGRFAEAIEDES